MAFHFKIHFFYVLQVVIAVNRHYIEYKIILQHIVTGFLEGTSGTPLKL